MAAHWPSGWTVSGYGLRFRIPIAAPVTARALSSETTSPTEAIIVELSTVGTVLAPSTPPTTVTVTCVVWVLWDPVPVTVMMKFPFTADMSVDTASVEVPVPPEANVTAVGFKDAVVPIAVGGTEADRLTVPENPELVKEIVKVAEPPAIIVADVGDALIVKSLAA
jgi:hypothetical protein